VKVYNILC